jgi:hypothetical protein
VWDSAAFSSIFLASSFSCSQTESTPAHTQVTQTVGRSTVAQSFSSRMMKTYMELNRPVLARVTEWKAIKYFDWKKSL